MISRSMSLFLWKSSLKIEPNRAISTIPHCWHRLLSSFGEIFRRSRMVRSSGRLRVICVMLKNWVTTVFILLRVLGDWEDYRIDSEDVGL